MWAEGCGPGVGAPSPTGPTFPEHPQKGGQQRESVGGPGEPCLPHHIKTPSQHPRASQSGVGGRRSAAGMTLAEAHVPCPAVSHEGPGGFCNTSGGEAPEKIDSESTPAQMRSKRYFCLSPKIKRTRMIPTHPLWGKVRASSARGESAQPCGECGRRPWGHRKPWAGSDTPQNRAQQGSPAVQGSGVLPSHKPRCFKGPRCRNVLVYCRDSSISKKMLISSFAS